MIGEDEERMGERKRRMGVEKKEDWELKSGWKGGQERMKDW